jgi:AcrR family transcriptional regulator
VVPAADTAEDAPVDTSVGAAPGRPRSETARRAILDAALRLAARDGYHTVTIKGIAQEAGVGRQTIYRWWTTKAEVLLEAVSELAERAGRPPLTGDAEADLRALLRATYALTDVAGSAVAGMMAESTHDPAFAARLQERLLRRRREVVRQILEAGQRDGQLGRDTGLGLVVDMVWGTMWYRILSGHNPVEPALADEITGAVVRLLGRVRT